MSNIDSYSITMTHGVLFIANKGVTWPEPNLPIGYKWPEGWTSPGGTNGGISIKYEATRKEKIDDRAVSPVGYEIVSEKLTVSTKLNGFTLRNLQLSWGGTYTTFPATVDEGAYEMLEGGGSSATREYLWGIEASWNDKGRRRPVRFICNGIAMNGSELALKRDTQIDVALEIMGVADLAQPEGKQLFKLYRNIGDRL